jgi:mono/diheme cytochrome c family protein
VRSTTRCGLAVLALLLGVVASATAQPLFSPAQDPLAGSRVFEAKGCAKCHAVNGVGGNIGPDLGRLARPRSFFDLATAMWNHLPRMTERMRTLGIVRPTLDAREAGDLIGFLYTLNYFDPPGNPETGRRLFTAKHCIVCHQVDGIGGATGPKLDHLARFGSPIFIAAAMWNHGPRMSEAMLARQIQRPTFTAPELRDLIAFLAPGSAAAPEGPLYVLPGRADEGRRLFAAKRCLDCHAVAGQGGRVGPDLVERGLQRSLLEFAAAMWNKAPAMLATMQFSGIAVPELRAEEMSDIVAYLYAIEYFGPPGNISRGWRVMADKGCLTCHGVYGERGKPASDLTRARAMETPAGVVAALWNHAVVSPPAPGGGKAPWPRFSGREMADMISLFQSMHRRQP